MSETKVIDTNKIYDVIIVGAGPVGLATAVGLQNQGIDNVLVIDQTRAFREVGNIIDLLPNGLKAIKFLDPNAYQTVLNASRNFLKNRATIGNSGSKSERKWISKNCQGELIRNVSLEFDDWVKKYGEGRLSLPWFELQTTLRNLLPAEKVKINYRCINLFADRSENCVRIDCLSDAKIAANPYAYWLENLDHHTDKSEHDYIQTSFYGKLVIGADGINSQVRKVIYQNTDYRDLSEPEYTGMAAITCGNIIDVSAENQQKLQDKFLNDAIATTITNPQMPKNSQDLQNIRIIVFIKAGKFAYIAHLPIDLESVVTANNHNLINLLLQELKVGEFPDEILKLVQASTPENMKKRPYYIHHVAQKKAGETIKPNWYQGRVVLVGDAAHGMPPFTAQGGNQGLEDALKITQVINNIAKNNAWNNLEFITGEFAEYDNLRRPFMEYMHSVNLKGFLSMSEQELAAYNQKVFTRDFATMVGKSRE